MEELALSPRKGNWVQHVWWSWPVWERTWVDLAGALSVSEPLIKLPSILELVGIKESSLRADLQQGNGLAIFLVDYYNNSENPYAAEQELFPTVILQYLFTITSSFSIDENGSIVSTDESGLRKPANFSQLITVVDTLERWNLLNGVYETLENHYANLKILEWYRTNSWFQKIDRLITILAATHRPSYDAQNPRKFYSDLWVDSHQLDFILDPNFQNSWFNVSDVTVDIIVGSLQRAILHMAYIPAFCQVLAKSTSVKEILFVYGLIVNKVQEISRVDDAGNPITEKKLQETRNNYVAQAIMLFMKDKVSLANSRRHTDIWHASPQSHHEKKNYVDAVYWVFRDYVITRIEQVVWESWSPLVWSEIAKMSSDLQMKSYFTVKSL